MWEEILKMALGNGLWAVLFCMLLLYQLRDGRTRESKYRQTIDVLLDRLDTLESVRADVSETLRLLRCGEKRKGAKPSVCVKSEAAGEVLRV